MEGVNLELGLRFTSPNFTQNFFGLGNQTINEDDGHPLGKDYNRVRIRTLKFAPALVWRGFLGSKVKLGASYENLEVEPTEDRFIAEFYADNDGEPDQSFLGFEGEYSFSNTDNAAFPTLGMGFSLLGGYKTNLGTGEGFAYLIPSLSVDHRIDPQGRLVLASKIQGHFNLGDGFEFHQAASIGGNESLRGFRFQRFSGKTAYYQSTDLRYSFRRRTTGLLPVTPGIYGGFDYGRVWLPGEDSGKWHNSFGGGLLLNGADLITASLGLFSSSDGARFSFGLGFGF
jgi:outer membrane protein assembly factor BamA